MTTATGTLKHQDWKEEPYGQHKPQKQTQMSAGLALSGDLEATADVHMLMHYNDEKNAHYAGHLVVDGRLGGRAGTFVIFEEGSYEGGVARSTWRIVEGSGTGALQGLSGHGSYEADSDNTVHYTLNYSLPG